MKPFSCHNQFTSREIISRVSHKYSTSSLLLGKGELKVSSLLPICVLTTFFRLQETHFLEFIRIVGSNYICTSQPPTPTKGGHGTHCLHMHVHVISQVLWNMYYLPCTFVSHYIEWESGCFSSDSLFAKALLCTVSVVRLIVFRRKPLQAVCDGR